MLIKLRGTLESEEEGHYSAISYQNADDFILDLKHLSEGLSESNCEQLSNLLVNPLLQEAESFRFCTVRLDLRENSDSINHALSVIWVAMKNGEKPPAPNSEEWKKWLLEELEKPLDTLPTFSNLDESSSSTLGLFEMVTQMMDKLDNEAFGNFILSMTKTVNDILGVYFLAKIHPSIQRFPMSLALVPLQRVPQWHRLLHLIRKAQRLTASANFYRYPLELLGS